MQHSSPPGSASSKTITQLSNPLDPPSRTTCPHPWTAQCPGQRTRSKFTNETSGACSLPLRKFRHAWHTVRVTRTPFYLTASPGIRLALKLTVLPRLPTAIPPRPSCITRNGRQQESSVAETLGTKCPEFSAFPGRPHRLPSPPLPRLLLPPRLPRLPPPPSHP
jgi:hypothetical protein